ncbi:MAG: DUF2510 domain-containing protein [Solirubrobacteraceae bacterium]|nr:DUF2510 domain-containing protein [Solirubrobacteraceae bacterium]
MQQATPPNAGGLQGLGASTGFTPRAFQLRAGALVGALMVPLILLLPASGAGGALAAQLRQAGRETSSSGWASASSVDIVMVLVAAGIAALLFLELQQPRSREWLLGTAALAFVLVGLSWPETRGSGSLGVGLRFGAYLQLVWAIAIAASLVLAVRDPTPRGAVTGPLFQGLGGGAAPAAPAPSAPTGVPAAPAPVAPPVARPATAAAADDDDGATRVDGPAGGGAVPRLDAGWYADPQGEKRLRYFDGATWTNHTAD